MAIKILIRAQERIIFMKEKAHQEFTEAYKTVEKETGKLKLMDTKVLYANRIESFHDGLETALSILQEEIRNGQKAGKE